MEKEYVQKYAELYHHHWWWRAREEIIVDTLRRTFGPNRSLKILDVGCGDGLFFDRLSSFGTVEGVEPEAEAVSAENPHRSKIHLCGLEEFSPQTPFGLVLLLDVLEHLENPAEYLQLALSKLAPGGKALITVPAFQSLWTTHDDLNHHRTRYSKCCFHKLADAAGMVIEEQRYLFHWVFFAKLLVRAKEAVLGSKPQPPGIPAAPINTVLRGTTIGEYKVARRLNLPFGGSLMVVGRKA
ncbi:MAG: methyltransferase domain-containing protein [Terriglobales bacterium]